MKLSIFSKNTNSANSVRRVDTSKYTYTTYFLAYESKSDNNVKGHLIMSDYSSEYVEPSAIIEQMTEHIYEEKELKINVLSFNTIETPKLQPKNKYVSRATIFFGLISVTTLIMSLSFKGCSKIHEFQGNFAKQQETSEISGFADGISLIAASGALATMLAKRVLSIGIDE